MYAVYWSDLEIVSSVRAQNKKLSLRSIVTYRRGIGSGKGAVPLPKLLTNSDFS